MSKVIVLGGCGAVGSVAVKTLAAQDIISEVVIGDWNIEKAQKLAKELGPKVSSVKVNAEDEVVTMDAMKMEIPVYAPVDGIVKEIKSKKAIP